MGYGEMISFPSAHHLWVLIESTPPVCSTKLAVPACSASGFVVKNCHYSYIRPHPQQYTM